MRASSTRTRVLFGVWIAFSAGVVKIFGDHYIWPLPMWLRLVIAATCIALIATAAIYSRRKAGRPASEP